MGREERRKDFDELHGMKAPTPPPPVRRARSGESNLDPRDAGWEERLRQADLAIQRETDEEEARERFHERLRTPPPGPRFSLNAVLWATCAVWVFFWIVGVFTSVGRSREGANTLPSLALCTSLALMGTMFVYCVTAARRRG